MQLTEEQKKRIKDILDSEEFISNLYEGLDEEERSKKGQFYTPADICIKMLEMYETNTFSNQNILDPCCGSGNLLIAMLAAGADSDKIYGNEYDKDAVKLCRKRINRACDILSIPHIKDFQIHQGNALQYRCLTEFSTAYDRYYKSEYIDDLNYAQGRDTITNRKLSWDEENKQATIRAELKNNKSRANTLFEGLF